MKKTTRTDKSILSNWWWSVDRLTLFAILILVTCGIVLVTAASPAVAERYGLQPFFFVKKQIVLLIPSLALLFGVSMLGQKMLWRISSIAFAGTLVLIVAAILFGPEVKGATRWISLPGGTLQPSEFSKPCLALVSAWLLARARQKPGFPGYKLSLGIYLLTLCLLLLQPDLGMAFVLSCIWGAQMFLSGLPMLIVIALGIAGAGGLFGAYMFFPHVSSRIDRFLDPAAGDNYQVEKSLAAFSNGGFFGTGPGEGMVKMTLPDAHEDFIFAVAGEEFGMIAAMLIIALYAFIIIRSIMRVYRDEDLFTLLAVTGLLVQLGLQSLVHMGSSLQLLPAKGMTLPFISYGGSSLLSFGFAMGALLSLTRKKTSGLSHDAS
jgi:cell division protein FtsW